MKTAALIATAAIGGGTISGTMIRAHTIPLSALQPSAIRALRGQRGPAGAPGLIDPSKIHVVQQTTTLQPGQHGPVDAMCAPGQTVISGGGTAPGLIGGYPIAMNGQEGWEMYGNNTLTVPEAEGATAICVST